MGSFFDIVEDVLNLFSSPKPTYKPGQKAGNSGIYNKVDANRNKVKGQAVFVKGKKVPPAPKGGYWEADKLAKHKEKK